MILIEMVRINNPIFYSRAMLSFWHRNEVSTVCVLYSKFWNLVILFNLATWDLLELDEWVGSIEQHSAQIPYVIVGTHADLITNGVRKQYEMLLKRWAFQFGRTHSFRYPNAKKIMFMVSNAEKDVHRLRKIVCRLTTSLCTNEGDVYNHVSTVLTAPQLTVRRSQITSFFNLKKKYHKSKVP